MSIEDKEMTIKVVESNEKGLTLNVDNNGFKSFEILGFLEVVRSDLLRQIQETNNLNKDKPKK